MPSTPERTEQVLALRWRSHHVADVEGASWTDFPWAEGRFILVELLPELREALLWLAQMADADELQDPPFSAALLEDWSLTSPGGDTLPISPPLVDFEAGTVTWR